jgi:hypothetical protein
MVDFERETIWEQRERGSMRMRVALVQPRERVASRWRNALGSGQKLWLLAEPFDDGQHVRYSLAPCHRFPLERHQSQMGG